MSLGLLVAFLVAAWFVAAVLLPMAASRRARRALNEAEDLRHQVARLGDEIARLRTQVTELGRAGALAGGGKTARPPEAQSVVRPPPVPPAHVEADDSQPLAPPALEEPPPEVPALGGPEVEPRDDAARTAAAPSQAQAPQTTLTLEERIGANWLLYVGIATLILGSAYFIRYAFENNWVTPWMRVAIGSAAGLVLVEAGRRFSRRDLGLFGQMLQGGGVAMLYLAAYAALNIYGLVASPVAFAWMIAITAVAAHQANRERSQGLAVLAVAGGFLTPFLVGGDADRQGTLFAYDALLVAGTLWLARRHQWPSLNLASWTLTALTILTWADRYYTPSRRLATELWLTLFAGLFVLIWRSLPPLTTLGGQLAQIVIGATPLVYHIASLQILWRWTAGLLVYLIAVTAVGVSVAGHWRRPWLRLATWLLVAVPTVLWLSEGPARWDSAPFIAVVGIYALHLVAQFREHGTDDERPTAVHVALLHLNGLWLWAVLLEKLASHRLGVMTLALAAWNAALAAGLWGRARESALHHLALASALAAAWVAFEYDGAAVTAAWAVEGAGLAWLGFVTGRRWLRVGGLALLGTAVVRVVLELMEPAAAAALPIVSARSLVAWVVVALLLFVAALYQRHRVALADAAPRVVAGLVVVAALTILIWASSEVDAWFAQAVWAVAAGSTLPGRAVAGAGAVTSASLARDVALSTLWAAYALVLVALGMRRNYRPLRLLAIVLFAVTAAKVFALDLARLDRFYRILSTVGLGLLLLIASYLYQRFSRTAPAHESRAPDPR